MEWLEAPPKSNKTKILTSFQTGMRIIAFGLLLLSIRILFIPFPHSLFGLLLRHFRRFLGWIGLLRRLVSL